MPDTDVPRTGPGPQSREALRRAAWLHWKEEFPRQIRNAAFRSIQGAIAAFAGLLLGGTLFVIIGKPVWMWLVWLWKNVWTWQS